MEHLTGYIATGLVSFVVGLLLQRAQAKAVLLYWIPATFSFHVQQPKVSLRTDLLTVQNAGKATAKDIEIIHSSKPDHFQFSTPISYSEKYNANGEHIICIQNLGPGEFINLQNLNHATFPSLLSIRSSAGPAPAIAVQLRRIPATALQYGAGFLMLLGAGFSAYWIGAAIIYLSEMIGVG